MNKRSYEKYQSAENILYQENIPDLHPKKHLLLASEVAGSWHFSTELMERNPKFKEEVELLYADNLDGNNSHVIFNKHLKPTFTTSKEWMDKQFGDKQY